MYFCAFFYLILVICKLFKVLSAFYTNNPALQQLSDDLLKGASRLQASGLCGSSLSLMLAGLFNQTRISQFIILNDADEAAYLYDDLAGVVGEDKVVYFPSSYKRSVKYGRIDQQNVVMRAHVLRRLNSFDPENPFIVVTGMAAVSELVISHDDLSGNTLLLRKGEKVSPAFVLEVLTEYSFERVDFVYEPGQYAVRGSIIDVFSFSNDQPYRIDFFGDEVETIRLFDVETQISESETDELAILPEINYKLKGITKCAITANIPPGFLIVVKDLADGVEALNRQYDETDLNLHFHYEEEEIEIPDKSGLLLNGDELARGLVRHRTLEIGKRAFFAGAVTVTFETSPQPVFGKKFELLADNLLEWQAKGYRTIIVSNNPKQFDRLATIFESIQPELSFIPETLSLAQGFIDHQQMKACFTDHQIFERYHKFNLRTRFTRREAVTLKEIKGLQPGDYVVHIDHGIGRFGGLQTIDSNGKRQEVIRLVYQDNDVLLVSIHALHKISKYKDREGEPPRMHKLGSGTWQKAKNNTKRKVKDIARELIDLYAKRMASEGYSFSPDTYLQEELEASFIYEDTPDQVKSTREVKQGMEASWPMDRLVCGDVGFGKTEVAIRAAFKATADSKQVAVLVPTTILALQHFKTFRERLKEFPVNIDYISRLRKPADQKAVLDNVREGKIDIIIGTHRLLSKEVVFKDLGLLIIDEEQKFGVADKEKLRSFKLNVDTLTLTATPIPRTLQFSLMGARDLSIINTPPPNRHPVMTEVHTFNEDIIREGIMFEVSRGGQVFFIHNRVQNIEEIQAMIRRLCSGIKTVVAHGQMDGKKLEDIMLGFISGDYDVLIATTIIESGLDIPNANTIFIHNAQNFGLSDLHQLRGRVGRSNKKAFCYLLAPPVSTLPQEARRRLKAIEEFSELGSGFNLAMQDLDIRGAGNMLGGEQSGFIADIGFETFQQILNEALLELRTEEFSDLYAKQKSEADVSVVFLTDCQVDTDFELHLPEPYIENVAERIHLYRELDNIKSADELERFARNLEDRFGPMPSVVKQLLEVVPLRWLAISLGIEKILLKNGRLIASFVSKADSPYYQSAIFTNVIAAIQSNARLFSLKQSADKLSLHADGVTTVSQAIAILNKLVPPNS